METNLKIQIVGPKLLLFSHLLWLVSGGLMTPLLVTPLWTKSKFIYSSKHIQIYRLEDPDYTWMAVLQFKQSQSIFATFASVHAHC